MMKLNDNILNTISEIEEIICKVYNITLDDLYGKRKFRTHSDARSILYYILHTKLLITFYRLSKIYNKHHSIIIRAVNKCEYLIKYDKSFYQKYHMIETRIKYRLKF